MSSVVSLLGASLVLFAATNLDDLLLLVVIASDRRRHYPPAAVLAGQIVGFGGILLISLLGFWSGLVVPDPWMGCLGLLPLALGLRQLWDLGARRRGSDDDSHPGFLGHPEQEPAFPSSWRRTTVKVAALTLANGSDNVSVYLPLFARLSPVGLAITLIAFGVGLVGLWGLAQWLSHHDLWQHRIQTLGPRVSPLVLIALGLWLLKGSILWPSVIPSISFL